MDMHDKELNTLYEAIISLKTPEECHRFLEDICTVKEVHAMSQRLQVAKLLEEGKNYIEISEETGASSATICRVNKCLTNGSGYRVALDRINQAGV